MMRWLYATVLLALLALGDPTDARACTSTNGYGVYGSSVDNTGVYGTTSSAAGYGVYGANNSYLGTAVYGYADGSLEEEWS